MKYRKKPVVIDAVQWSGKNFDEVMQFMGEDHGHKLAYEDAEEAAIKSGKIYIKTLEGLMCASKMDFIIKGVNGEFYPCKPDIFEKTYEQANDISNPAPQDLRERAEAIAFSYGRFLSYSKKVELARAILQFASEVSAEKDRALIAANATIKFEKNRYDALLTEAKQRIAELEAVIKEQDSIIGSQIRKISFLEDSELRRNQWLDKAKKEAGYDTRASFNDVWKDMLAKVQKP